jgi:hypothetical protein
MIRLQKKLIVCYFCHIKKQVIFLEERAPVKKITCSVLFLPFKTSYYLEG